jgi:hypothetical protein
VLLHPHCENALRSDGSIVMICFSPDDTFLLSSAVDNELRQYTAVDGRCVGGGARAAL